jgi:hypothetical protein
VCSICKSCVFSLTKVKRNVSVCLSMSWLFVFFSLAHSYIHFFFLHFFSCCAIFVLILKLYIIILLSHSCTHKSHAIDSFLLCMHSFVFCSSSLVFWLSLPTSHSFSFLRNMFDFTVCSFDVIVHIFLYSISLFFFAVCERAVLKEYTYITYGIHMNV